MRGKLLIAGALTLLVAAAAKADKKYSPLKVVENVDLVRYEGLWYEIARLPNRFEKACASDVTARYTRDGSRIKVVNQCRTQNGELKSANGVAKLADKRGGNARLKVRFAPSFLSFLPFVWANYQIIELSPDYDYAVIGEPGRKYLWVLSRTPKLDEGVYRSLLAKAAAQGFEVSKVIRTNQN